MAQTITNALNRVRESGASDDLKARLTELNQLVGELVKKAPAEAQAKAAKNLDALTTEATSKTPDCACVRSQRERSHRSGKERGRVGDPDCHGREGGAGAPRVAPASCEFAEEQISRTECARSRLDFGSATLPPEGVKQARFHIWKNRSCTTSTIDSVGYVWVPERSRSRKFTATGTVPLDAREATRQFVGANSRFGSNS